jgi:1,4-dihydroxy-6-naphthoate synthase
MNCRTLTLGYSPCPNDTFIFHALVHGLVPLPGITVHERLEDVETLNRLALAGTLDLTKISYHAFGHLRRDYALLRSGGALGRGCGPLVVARAATTMAGLRGRTIAIPGQLTTANLLLQLHGAGYDQLRILPFHQIVDAVASGEVAAGVIIHESRFTYQQHKLVQVEDLGAWWEDETGLPIPLGGILAKRSLGDELIDRIDAALAASVRYAFEHPAAACAYIKAHAQELDDRVIARHIELYVNEFSLDLGDTGVRAVEELLRRATVQGLIPACELPLFTKNRQDPV